MKTRRANGKFTSISQGVENSSNFEPTPMEKEEMALPQITPRQNYTLTARANGASIQIPIPNGGWNLMKILILILMFSPWIYLILRKQNRESVSQKVSEFFEENFNCKPCPPCFEPILNKTEELPKKNGL